MVLFLALQIFVPSLLRFSIHRRAIPLYAPFLVFFQDAFVLSILCFFPLPLAAALGLFIHIYLLLDAFLYREMRLRLKLRHGFLLRDLRHWLHSAREMGFSLFVTAVSLLFLAHGGGYFFYRNIELQGNWLLSAGLGILAFATRWGLPKSLQYAVNHPFFLKQSSPPLPTSASLPPLKWGPKVLDLPIGPNENPHFVFLFLESFPAKYVSPKTTPHFHRLMQKGIFFSNFYANGTLTYRALLSSLFGTPPGNTAVGLSPYVNAPLKGLPQFFKKRGYRTAFHHNGSLKFDRQEPFLQKHFDEIADQYAMGEACQRGWGIHDEKLMQYSADWLERQEIPAFATMFTISNHHPWVLPEHYKAPPGSRFEQTLHYTDFALGCFIEHLKGKNLSRKTVLFILGDHGQPMGEHKGNFYNSRFLYEENVHIPLLILAEGRIGQPTAIAEIGSQIDLLPTVLDLFGERQPCLGHSLLRQIPDRTAFLQNPYSEGFLGCRQGRWKWIESRLFAREELYDLQEDPLEEKNMAASHPQLVNSLKEQTSSFFAHVDLLYRFDAPMDVSPDVLDVSHSMIRDRELEELATSAFIRINLENCLLVTDRGISALFSKCPNLEELCLKGVFDVGKAFATPLPRLRVLDVSDAPEVEVETLAQFCPHLQELSFNMRNTHSFPLKRLIRLRLFEAHQMTDEAMIHLIENSPHLGRLVVHGCEKITDRTLSFLKDLPLELLWLFDAPQISDVGIAHLSQAPLRSLALEGCPLLTEKSKPFLQTFEALYLKDCPGLSHKSSASWMHFFETF